MVLSTAHPPTTSIVLLTHPGPHYTGGTPSGQLSFGICSCVLRVFIYRVSVTTRRHTKNYPSRVAAVAFSKLIPKLIAWKRIGPLFAPSPSHDIDWIEVEDETFD